MIQKIIAFITSLCAFFCSLFGISCSNVFGNANKVDMSKFTMTFSDDFDTFDRSVWSGHYQYGDASEIRRGGYWNKNIVYVDDGSLVIPLCYLENGMGGKGAGWYSAGIDTDSDSPEGFSQKYGYFECRCKLPAVIPAWAAFWLMNDGVYNEDGSGEDGTEIDIFESVSSKYLLRPVVSSNLHYDGYGENHKFAGSGSKRVCGDPYNEFHTYGLEWNKNEYIFYIDGVETYRTSFGGVSKNPEYMILSIEMGGSDGIPSEEIDKNKTYNFVIDYVKAYQYK